MSVKLQLMSELPDALPEGVGVMAVAMIETGLEFPDMEMPLFSTAEVGQGAPTQYAIVCCAQYPSGKRWTALPQEHKEYVGSNLERLMEDGLYALGDWWFMTEEQ